MSDKAQAVIANPLTALQGLGLGVDPNKSALAARDKINSISSNARNDAAHAITTLLPPKDEPPVPVVMPLPDDEAVQAAKKRQLAIQMGSGGRASTILSQGSDKLGG